MTTHLRRLLRVPLFLIAAMLAASAAQAQPLAITSTGDYGTLWIGEVNLPFTATGGTGSYFWSIVNGAVPPGLQIRNDLPPQYAPATIGLSGIATTPGTYVFDVQVFDGVSTVVKTGVTVKITALRITTPYNLPDAFENVAYSTQLSAAGGAGPLTWSGTPPAGLSLAADGTLSGTPLAPGFWNVPLQVTDGTDTVGWSPSLNVYQVRIDTDGALPYATINQPYNQTITAGADGSITSFNLYNGGLPAGFFFDNGALYGTPTQTGRYTFTVSATDVHNHVYWKNMSLTVVAVPAQLPQVQPYGQRLDDCAVGQPCQRAISSWSAAKPPFSWAVSGLPSGMSFRSGSAVSSFVWPGDVELWGSPDTPGNYNITATVTDATGATATNTFPLHVSNIWPAYYPPNGTIGVPYLHVFRVLGGSASYTGTLTGGALPLGLTFNGSPSQPSITGTPTEGGSFTAEFTFDDGSGNTSKVTTYFYIANAGNASQPITIFDGDLGIVTVNVPWQRQLSGCCRASLTWTLEAGSSLPPGMSLSTGGNLTGTPTASGQHTFVVRAADTSTPADYTTRRLTVIVTPVYVSVNTALPYGNVSTAYNYQLQAAGGTGPYTWTLATGSYLPPGLTLSSGGLISGTPTGAGLFGFTLNVLDTATSNRTAAFFTLPIYPAGQYPPLYITTGGSFGTWNMGRGEAELAATGGAGGYVWSLVSGTLPPGLVVRPDGPSFFSQSYSGAISGIATTPGLYTFTLRVTDAANATADLPGSMTVTPLSIKELWNLPDGFKNQAYSYTLTPVGNIGAATWSTPCGSPSCALPPGLTLNTSTGVISGTPTTPGVYNARIAVTADGASVSYLFTINVFAINVGTSTPLAGGGTYELPNATQNSAYSVTFTATGCVVPCTFTSNTLPNGLSLNATTGVVSGTYTGGTGSRFTFRITATDSSTSTSYSRQFAIRGTAVGVVPAISLYSNRFDDCTLGMGCVRSVYVSTGAAAPYTWAVSGLPIGMSLRPAGVAYQNSDTAPAGDASLWGAPRELGDFNVTITVTDANGVQGQNTFPLHVSELYEDVRMPNGTFGTAYGPGGLGAKLRIIGGTGSYSTTIMSPSPNNRLPIGLSLNGAQNTVSGTPGETGSFSPDIEIVDTANPVHRLRVFNFFSIADQGVGTISINTGSDLGHVSTGSYSQTFSACCVASYIWSLESGTLPTGTTLNTNTGVVSGSLSATGTFVFALRARNSIDAANFAVKQFTLNVTSLNISPTTLLPGDVGSAYSQPIVVSGASGTTTWTLMPYNYLPPGLSLTSPGPFPPGNGLLSGTPTSSGQFAFNLKVTDGGGNFVVRTINVTIYPHLAYPPVTCTSPGPNLGPFTLGVMRQELTCAAGGTGQGYTYSLKPGATTVPGLRVQQGPPLPTNFSASTTAGLMGVLTTAGVFPTAIRVTDSLGNFVDRNLTVTVVPTHILSQTTLPKAKYNTLYSFSLSATGGSGYSYAISSGSLPAGLTLSSGGVISGTPTSTSTATATFSVNLSASGVSTVSIGSFSLTVNAFDINAVGTVPVGSGVLPAATVNSAYSQTFVDTGCTGTCTWSISNAPNTLSINSTTGALTGTPTTATSTSFTVTRNSTGGNGTVSRVFSLQVLPAATQVVSITAPTVTYPAVGSFVTVGSSVGSQLAASGGIPPYTWSLDSGTLPPGVTIQASGETLGGTLAPGFSYLAGRAMAAGVYTFTLKATDSASNFATRTLVWTVAELNNQYTSLPLSGTLNVNSSYNQTLLGLGGSATGGTGNYAWTNLSPLPLGMSLSSGGVLSGSTNEAGTFTIPVMITDTNSAKVASNISLTVTGPPVIGGGSAVSFSTNSSLGSSQAGSLFNTTLGISGGTPFASTPGPAYIVTVESPSSLPPGFTLLTADALAPGTAAGSTVLSGTSLTPGSYAFTLRATDSVGNFALRTFTLTVMPYAVATGNTLPDGGVGEAYSERVLAWDNAGAVTWSVSNGSSLPPGLSLIAGVLTTNGGTLAQAGTFSFSLDATASTGAVTAFTFNLKVTSFRITSPQELPSPAIIGVPFSYTLTATAAATWQVTAGGFPSGFGLSSNGVLSGTLTSATNGPFVFTAQATVGSESQSRRFTLYTRTPNPAVLDIQMATTLLNDATVGLSVAYSLTPNGGTAPYTWSAGTALPSGLSLVTTSFAGSPATASALTGFFGSATLSPGGTVLAGVPTTAGDYSFDLILTDSLGAQTRRTFKLHVSPVAILQGSMPPGRTGVAYSRQFTAVGGSGPYTFSMRAVGTTQDMLPPGLSLSTSGLLSGTPTSTGNYAFILEAKDSLNRTFSRRFNNFFVTNASLIFVSNFNLTDTPVGVGRRSLSLGVQLLTINSNGTTSTATAPGTYTWALKAGSGPLPPGMSLLTGDLYASTDETVLGGQPTTPGTYVFTLQATRVGNPGNVSDHTFTFHISPMQSVAPPTEAFIPPDLPPARVGVPYSTTLKIAGGTPPYSFGLVSFFPLPDWLTLSPTGVLSGTPPAQSIGSYTVAAAVTDSAAPTARTLSFASTLFVTSATGAPALQAIQFREELGASVGVPFNYPVDFSIRGGTGPFTWTVAPGSSLPPGIVLLPGANGVSSYLGGVPTTITFPDEFDFDLNVTDSGSPAQSLTVPFQMLVASLTLRPDTVPPGIVGVPYSVQLTPSGAAPPYNVFVYPLESDFPPGMMVDASGLFHGTPTAPGNFPFLLAVQDSTGMTVGAFYRFAVDNALGEAPSVFLTPTPIEISYRYGDPNPSPTPIAVNATSGTFPFGLAVMGIPGATLSAGSGTAPGASSVIWNMAGVGVGTYYGIVGARAEAVNLIDQIPIVVHVTAPCGYALSPASASALAAGGAGAFGMATGGDCNWTAVSNAPWITITSAASGTGSTTINYSVAPNDNGTPLDPLDDPLTPRIGTIGVQGQLYSITQFGSSCAFGISPTIITAPAAGGQAVVTVTASNSSCQWTASGLGATWTNAPTPVTGNGNVTVTIPANALQQDVQLTATIAGQTFTVLQSGLQCNVGLSAPGASATAAGGPGSVFVTRVDGCGYDTVVGPSWVSVTSGGSHDTTPGGPLDTLLVYEVQPNSTTIARTGTLTIGGQAFQIAQDGLACSVTLDTSNLHSPYGPAGGNVGTIGVTANGSNCTWTAESGADWALISPHSGGGVSSTIQVSVTSNALSTTPRTTDLSIAGQVVSVLQAGTTCTYATQSSTGSFPAPGGFGSVGVSAPGVCGWSAVSNDPWLTVVSPASPPGSSGNANVLFSVGANGPAAQRVGTISILNALNAVVRTYTVTQAPLACSYTLTSGTAVSLPSAGTSGPATFSFSAPGGCTPTAVSYAAWISVVNPVGAGTVEYQVEPNPTSAARSGTIQLGDKTFKINQAGAVCGYSLNSYGAAFAQPGGPGAVLGTRTSPSCDPLPSTNQPSFITLTLPPTEDPETGILTLPYSVLPYISLNPNIRYGTIVFGGRQFTVKQTSW